MREAHAILKELESISRHALPTARSLLEFLQHDDSNWLSEGLLLRWLSQRLESRSLESELVGLTYVDKLVQVMASRGLAEHGLVRRVRKQPDLLSRLLGGRPAVPSYWAPVFTEFERSLRGLAPLHQARCLRDAARVIATLGRRRLDEATFFAWLDGELSRRSVSSVLQSFPRAERFCQFLVERGQCEANPALRWRRQVQELKEALRCRKNGDSIPLRKARYRSFLAPHIEDFAAFKQSLGKKYAYLTQIDCLGRYAEQQEIYEVGQLGATTLQEFMASRGWADSTTREFQSLLRRFFRFLVRIRVLTDEEDPTRLLGRRLRRERTPYIYSIQEVGALLESVQDVCRHPFHKRLYSTIILLIYACGMRRREPLRLQVRDFDPNRRTLFIRRTKFDKDRLIPVGPKTCERLNDYHRYRIERLGEPSPEAPLFVQTHGQSVKGGSLNSHFQAACRRASIGDASLPKPRLHDLRHTFAVHRLYKWYLEGSEPASRLPLLSIYLGHVSCESTRHYLHLSQDLLRVAGRPLQRAVEECL